MAIPDAQILHAEVVQRGILLDATAGPVNWANVFHLRRLAIVAPASKAQLRTIFDTTITQVMLAAASDAVSGTTIGVRWLSDKDDREVVAAATPLTAGQILTDGLPNQNAVRMLLRTAVKGKSARGAKSFPGLAEAHTTRGVISGAGVALWQAVRDAILPVMTDAGGNQWQVEVVSRKLSDFTTTPTTISANDVSQVLLNLTVGSMDSRRPATVR